MRSRKKINAAVLFSGGKDSFYALLKSIKKFNIKCLISLKPLSKESYMFHFPNIDLVKLQSKALNLPLIFIKTKGEKEKELSDLKRALRKAIEEYHVKGVFCGALASNYQKTRLEKVCQELNLSLFAPLWKKEPEEYMNELIKSGFKIIITAVASFGLSQKWLGRKLDGNALADLIKLNKKTKIHLGGEGGEYETFVLDGPIFKSKIKIQDYDIEMENQCTGRFIIKDLALIKKS